MSNQNNDIYSRKNEVEKKEKNIFRLTASRNMTKIPKSYSVDINHNSNNYQNEQINPYGFVLEEGYTKIKLDSSNQSSRDNNEGNLNNN